MRKLFLVIVILVMFTGCSNKEYVSSINVLNWSSYIPNYVIRDFEEKYGVIGRGFIHVHHIVPISTIRESYQVDPVRDLVPVCPNCHAMLHRGHNGITLTIDELKTILHKNK